MIKRKSVERTSQGLRDILFEEIDQLRGENGDPQRATAVVNLAKQIMNTARVEMDFVRTTQMIEQGGGNVMLGSLRLGS